MGKCQNDIEDTSWDTKVAIASLTVLWLMSILLNLLRILTRDYYTMPQLEEKYKMSHAAVLSFVTRNKISRITQGRTVYYFRTHIDTLKGERESIDPNYYTYAEVMEKYHFSKDRISYYVHNYEIDNHKQGRFTVINRKEFDRIIKERMETNSL